MQRLTSGGGWKAILYTLRQALRVGPWRLWRAIRAKNACKTCALGMGGQKGGMRNEAGHWPEVCKKSLQAMVADMQKGLEPSFFARYSIEQLRGLSPRELEWCGRISQPLIARPGDTNYRPIEWDEALDQVANQLRATSQASFFYASGRSSTEAGFLLQLFARLFGTNYVNNCSFYCHQASGVGLGQSLGTSTATVTLDDVENTDFFMLIGGNPASNHPRFMRTLMNIRRSGGEVIVVNPLREIGLVNFSVPSDPWSLLFGSPIASLYVQPHIGGDIAFLMGVAKHLIELGATDRDFIDRSTTSYADFETAVRSSSWEALETALGVSRSMMVETASRYARAKTAVFGWTMGITHHLNGVENVRAIVNLALMRGMVGRPRAGLLPIRGHSNVQAMGSVGVTPALKQAILENLERHLGVMLPRSPGLDTMGCMKAADAGRMKTAFCLGGNLFGSNPDTAFARRAISQLEQVTYLSTTLNTTHAHGTARETIILPVLARDEEPQPTIQESMFNFVRFSDGGPKRQPNARSETSIITELARRVLRERSPVDWTRLGRLCHVREMIAAVVPGWEQLARSEANKQEFTIPGRIFHAPVFPTSDGKAHFKTLTVAARGEGLRLMTIRSEGQFNTVVYEEEDIYRGQERRDVILMNREDIARLGLIVNQPITVRSSVGVMSPVLVREFDIRAGNVAMYLPEANVLVPTDVDPESKTPAFKSVAVSLEPLRRTTLPLMNP
ncbi:MAG: histidine kinase [Planctomycetia bacterium]|nr:histidine kinase [Planctomycetia bacterium]